MLSALPPLRRSDKVRPHPNVRCSGEASVQGGEDEPEFCRTSSVDASVVESRRREFLDSRLHCHRACSRCDRNCAISDTGMEGILMDLEFRRHGRVRDNRRVPPRTRASRCEAESNRRADTHLRGGVQRIGIAGYVDREPSKSPCESRHDRRCFQPASRRILVGASAMALSMAAVAYEEVVSGFDPASIYDLGQASNPARAHFNRFWLLLVRLDCSLLDGRNSSRLLSSHAGFREQSSAFETGTCRRRGFQSEHLVARPASTDGMGRELAR